jgi:polyhydroxyalkanoate synthesis regulator phasin
MPPTPDWKRALETGMQFTEVRRSQARAIASDLVSQGQLARDQVSNAVDEIVELSRRRTEDLRKIVQKEVSRQLSSLGLATKADLARLERRLTKAARNSKTAPAKKKAAKAAGKTTKPSTEKKAAKATRKAG